MSPGLRKLALSVHLVFSVGWIGAVVAYLVLVVAAMAGRDAQTLRAAWIAMGLTGRFAIVPLSVGSLVTGLVMSLGTRWGLFKHYWVLFSFVLTILAAAVLVSHMETVRSLADVAAETDAAVLTEVLDGSGPDDSHREDEHLAGQLVSGLPGELLHAGVGLLVLLVVQVLNVYKPRGMTPYGWRKQYEQPRAHPD